MNTRYTFFSLLLLFLAMGIRAQEIGINSVTVRFNQPPSSYTLEQTPLRYNKDFAFAMHIESGNKDIYTHAFPLLNGGEINGTTYPGYYYTDGAGNDLPFKMSTGIFSFQEGDTLDAHDPGGPYADQYATWPELNELYQAGWGIYNQGMDSGNSYDPYYSIRRNHSYVKRMMQAATPGGPEMKVMLNPEGLEQFTLPAFDHGYIAAYRPYTFGVPSFNVNAFVMGDTLKMGRTFLGNNSSMSNLVDTIAARSVNGANHFGSAYTSSVTEMPGYIFPIFRAYMNLIEDTYGRYGSDNIWMTTEEEIVEYLMVNENITVFHQLIGDELVIYFDSDLPTDFRHYASSLLVNADATVLEIQIDGGTNNTFSGIGDTVALINLEWDGYVQVPDSVNAETYVSKAEDTQLQTDWNIAMDYVEILEPGPTKEYFRDRLCAIEGITPPEGYCDCFTYIGPDTTICTSDCITLSVAAGQSYEWSTGDTTQSIEVCPEESTEYFVTVYNEVGCPSSDTILISVIDPPVPVVSQDTSICLGACAQLTVSGGIAYEWSTGDTTSVIEVCPEESTTYYVDVFNDIGCSVRDSVWVNVLPLPVPMAGPDTTVCQGNPVTLLASGGVRYEWSNGDTTFWSIVVPEDTTTYYVEVFNAFGCSATDSVRVNVRPGVDLSLTPDTGVCANECIQLIAAGGDSYVWSTGETNDSIIVCPTDTSWYYINAFLNNGCSRTDSVRVDIYPKPQAEVSGNPEVCNADTIVLSASGGSYYVWEDQDTVQQYETIVWDTNYYHVKVFNQFHCYDEDSVLVMPTPLPEVEFWGIDPAYCTDDDAVVMYAFPGPGWFTGPGVDGNIFDPAMAGPGIHPVAYHFTEVNTGCTGADTLMVTVGEKPLVDLGPDTTICNYDSITLDAGAGYDSYLWFNEAETRMITIQGSELQEGNNLIDVVVTNDGCAGIGEKVVSMEVCNSGLKEEHFKQFSIFPNPAEHSINIKFNTYEKNIAYAIMNPQGNILQSGKLQSCAGDCTYRLEIDDLPTGLYYLQIKGENALKNVKFMVK